MALLLKVDLLVIAVIPPFKYNTPRLVGALFPLNNNFITFYFQIATKKIFKDKNY
ncbi:hypothetical protein MBCUR_03710 [Methanobrevibacter curvatus]|uniref:Uncharacterized protein n=1 Tax=Methanobrevibacter curvatus TaxID=49547 RepID=A0A166CT16_9EURY|nr:hypothetical protein MBCUR_03710 [Methanobrevibacter curvatus]